MDYQIELLKCALAAVLKASHSELSAWGDILVQRSPNREPQRYEPVSCQKEQRGEGALWIESICS
jgi:hypothetical protein